MSNTSLPDKITCINTKILFIVLIVLNILVLIFGIANLATQRWITQGDPDDFNEMFGNLQEVYKSDSEVLDRESYVDIADYFGDLKDAADQPQQEEGYDLLEQKFLMENIAGISLIVCGTLGLIFFIVTLIGLLLTLLKTSCRALTAICVSLGCTLFQIGGIIYFFVSYGQFNDDCQRYLEIDSDDDVNLERSCWIDGPSLLLFNLIFFLGFSIMVCVVNCCALKIESKV